MLTGSQFNILSPGLRDLPATSAEAPARSPGSGACERIQSGVPLPLELAVRSLRHRVVFLPPQSGQTCLETPVSRMTPPHIPNLFSTLFLPLPCPLGIARLRSRAPGKVVTYWLRRTRSIWNSGREDGGYWIEGRKRSSRCLGRGVVSLSCRAARFWDLNSAVSTVRMLSRQLRMESPGGGRMRIRDQAESMGLI